MKGQWQNRLEMLRKDVAREMAALHHATAQKKTRIELLVQEINYCVGVAMEFFQKVQLLIIILFALNSLIFTV